MQTQTKLTLRMDRELVRRAKSYAEKSGKSVSAIVADYLERLDSGNNGPRSKLTPAVRSLMGVLKDASQEKGDRRKYLERKHQ